MKKNQLRLLVVTITFALIGLLAVQGYWLHVANQLNKDTFDQSVGGVLSSVSKRLEAREAFGFLEKKVNIDTDKLSEPSSSNSRLSKKIIDEDAVLGIEGRDISPELAVLLDLRSFYGVFVEVVYPYTPAYYANLRPGDIITEIGGQDVNSAKDIADVLNQFKRGDQLSLTFERLDEREKCRYVDCGVISHGNEIIRGESDSLSILRYSYSEEDACKDELQNLLAEQHLSRIIFQDDTDDKGAFITSFYGVDARALNNAKKEDVRKIAAQTSEAIVQEYLPYDGENPADTLIAHLFNDSSLISKVGLNKEEIKEVIYSKQGQVVNTYRYVNNIVAEILTNQKSALERLQQFDFDKILKEEFACRGMKVSPEWAIMNEYSQMAKSSKNYNPRNQHTYRTTLFPNDVLQEAKPSLFIYFPEQEGLFSFFSYSGLSFFAGGTTVPLMALLFILLLSLCFYFAVSSMIRQKKMSELKTDFINNMTHELKTPVSTIKLASEMISDANVPREHQERYVKIIQEENSRLGSQIERVLQIARIEKDAKLRLENVDVHEVLQHVMHHSTLQVQQKSGKILAELSSSKSTIEADRVHLSNIFSNLIENAVKYTPELPQIEIKTRDVKNGICVTVKDNGIGMSKDAQKRIFEKFYREPTGNLHDVKGFGLGLSYVKVMTEAHGGTVKVSSKLNQGSLFELFFPFKNQPEFA